MSCECVGKVNCRGSANQHFIISESIIYATKHCMLKSCIKTCFHQVSPFAASLFLVGVFGILRSWCLTLRVTVRATAENVLSFRDSPFTSVTGASLQKLSHLSINYFRPGTQGVEVKSLSPCLVLNFAGCRHLHMTISVLFCRRICRRLVVLSSRFLPLFCASLSVVDCPVTDKPPKREDVP